MILLAWALAAGPDPASVVGPPVDSPPADVDAATDIIAAKIRCPVCQGLSVADSPSESALAMKAEVRALVAQGYNEEQIIAWFEASYGEFIRLEPTTEGWNVLVWTLPVALVLGGGAYVAWTLRRREVSVAPTVDPVLQPYVERVLAEVGDPRE